MSEAFQYLGGVEHRGRVKAASWRGLGGNRSSSASCTTSANLHLSSVLAVHLLKDA